jgi:rhomboid protease GluP
VSSAYPPGAPPPAGSEGGRPSGYPESYPPPEPPPAPRMLRVEGLQARPTVTYMVLGLTFLVYLLQIASEYIYGGDWPAALGMKVNDLILAGQYWRFLTPALLHGSIPHILFNMYALYSIGPEMERHYGHGRFLVLYLLGAFAGNVLSFAFSTANSLGASTAIFGVFAAEGVFVYQNRSVLGPRARVVLNQIIILAVINLAYGMAGQGIDNWGHIGGLLGGAAFAWFAGPVIHREIYYDRMVISDERENSQAFLAAVVVGSLFAILAVVALYQRGGFSF